MSLACGIDVGGTKIAGGIVDESGTILEELQVVSPATDVPAIEAAIETLVTEGVMANEIVPGGFGTVPLNSTLPAWSVATTLPL